MPNGTRKFAEGDRVRVRHYAKLVGPPHAPHDVLGKEGLVTKEPTWMNFGGRGEWLYDVHIDPPGVTVNVKESDLESV